MRLSEAILKGCELRPQGYGDLFGVRFDGPLFFGKWTETSCALGAAFQAGDIKLTPNPKPGWMVPSLRGSGNGRSTDMGWELPPHWYSLLYESGPQQCPQCQKECDKVASTISHLNDDHRWPREAIACWLMPIEQQVEAKEPIQQVLIPAALKEKLRQIQSEAEMEEGGLEAEEELTVA